MLCLRRIAARTSLLRPIGHAGALAGLLLVDPAVGAVAEPTAVPERPAYSISASYADLVEAVLPAVVNVTTSRAATGVEPGAGPEPESLEEFMQRFYGAPPPAPDAGPQARRGAGSGFIIDPDGFVVTNDHVIADADAIEVGLTDGRAYQAELVGRDPQTDIALLKINTGEPLPFVPWGDSDRVRVGDQVLAVGNPFGLGGTVTAGIISARGRDIGSTPYHDFLQIDAPINRGNSGGPTFTLDGKVIGVNARIFSPSGGSIGIGFAIPSNLARAIVDELHQNGAVERGWLGVNVQSVGDDIASALGLAEPRGALVSSVLANGPADKAGIERGDVILAVDGNGIEEVRELPRTVATRAPGAQTKLEVWRDGERITLDVHLGRMPSSTNVASLEPAPSDGPQLGLSLVPLTSDQREQLKLPAEVQGVLVHSVQPGSPAAEKGLRRGDVIIEVAGKLVAKPADVRDRVREQTRSGKASLLVLVRRDDRERFVALRLASG